MTEVTEWDNNPRDMWVWDDQERHRIIRKVIHIVTSAPVNNPVVAVSGATGDGILFKHCAEINRRMTNKELSRWLRERPDREYKRGDHVTASVRSVMTYDLDKEDEEVDMDISVREGGGPWYKPFKEEEHD